MSLPMCRVRGRSLASGTPAVLAVLTAFGVVAAWPIQAAQVDTVWLGGTGNWNNAALWSAGVPDNGGGSTFNVFIDNGNAADSIVHLNQGATIDNLTIDLGDALYIDNSRELFVVSNATAGTINNAGTIHVTSTGSGTYLRPSGGVVTLTGGGRVMLGDHTSNWIYQGAAGGALLNVNNTIEGAGKIGWSGSPMAFTNQAAVIANFPAHSLALNPGGSTFTNTGTLRAENGATLSVEGSGLHDNTGGVIEALDASAVSIDGTTLRGGTLQTSGTGVIYGQGHSLLDGATAAIANSGVFRIPNGHECFAKGAINNAGAMEVTSTGGGTQLRPTSGVLTLTGGGNLKLGNHANNWIYQGDGAGSLVNAAGHTIRGAGKVGWSGAPMAFTNQGLVIAEFPETALLMNPAGSTFTNTGTLRAQSGGMLQLEGNGLHDNTGGVIEALDGSSVSIYGTTVRGGTLQTSGSGVIYSQGYSLLDGATAPIANNGVLVVPNGQDCYATGTIANAGSIELLSAGGGTHLRPTAGVLTLSGGGSVKLGNHANNWIYQGDGGGSLVNAAGHTIRGAGKVGWSGAPMAFTNQGLVVAEFPETALLMNAAGSTFTNIGTLRAQSGGTLRLEGSGLHDNTGGVIEALDGSTVTISATTVRGGTLQTTGSGVIYGQDNCLLQGTTSAIYNAGVLRVPNGDECDAVGTIHNLGTIELQSTGGGTRLRPSGGLLTFTGGGEVRMGNHTNNWIYQTGGGSLLNAAGHTIRGSGRLGWTSAATSVNNQGTIIADQPTALSIEAVPFTTSGQVIVNAGSTLGRPNGDFTQTAGSTTSNGTLTASAYVDIQGGTLGGSGSVSKTKNAGVVAPGDPAAIPTGTLTVSGTYAQSIGGALNIELAGVATGQADKLAVTGAATLGGTLNISVLAGYTPAPGDKFTVMTYASRSGQFATVTGTVISPTLSFFVEYGTDKIRLSARSGCGGSFACDTNCDGTVNQFDINAFIQAVATHHGCHACAGDSNGDGTTNTFDIQQFLSCLTP